MKKNCRIKLYLFISISISLVVLIIILLSVMRKKEVYYYLTNSDTYYLEKNDTSFNVIFYSNHQEDVYLSQEIISNIYLKSHTCEDYYELKLNNIKQNQKSIDYNDKVYYEKIFGLNLPLVVNEDFQLNDCYLEINYLSKEIVKLDIGSVIIYNSDSSNHLEVVHMKSIVNNISDKQLFVGLGLSLNSIDDLKITSIKPLDSRIKIQSSKIKKVDSDNYLNTTIISELLGENYDYLEKGNNSTQIFLSKENKEHYIIPLSYEKLILTNKMGLRIEYEIGGISYVKFVYPFTFFSTSDKTYQEVKYVPADYS